jgi:hypothetical protein
MNPADRPDWLIVLPMPYELGVVDEAVADTGETITETDAALASKKSVENVVMPRTGKPATKNLLNIAKYGNIHITIAQTKAATAQARAHATKS